MSEELDSVYTERAHLVAFLTALYPSELIEEGTDYPVVYINSPEGQLSWHINRKDISLFSHVPVIPISLAPNLWDGHTTEEKYKRVRSLIRRIFVESGGPYYGRC